MLERSLQWDICLLHFDEICFKCLFQLYCGKTTGPGLYTSQCGKEIATIKNNLKPMIEFKQVHSTLFECLPL